MKTREWWELVEINWQAIYAICEAYLPMNDRCNTDGEPTKNTVREQIEEARQKKDPVLARFLSEVWFRVPEKKTASLTGWDKLSDLVSEEPDW